MESKEIEALLEEHGVKATANRLIVASSLLQAGRPLSLMELEAEIETIDKSGIFRALTLFKDKHLVHTIEGGPEGLHYELCHSHDADHDEDAHVHFICERCHKTYCLEDIPIPDILLPEGYLRQTATFLIKGICPSCGKESDING